MHKIAIRKVTNSITNDERKWFGKLYHLAKKGDVNGVQQIWQNHTRFTSNIKTYGFMMKFYISHQEHTKALDIFDSIRRSNTLTNNDVTYLMALTACASLHSLKHTQSIHQEINTSQIKDLSVYNALIGAYSKCNDIKSAQHVFDSMTQRDHITHNAMLTALQDHGYNDKVIECYLKMDACYISDITYFIVLRAITHHTDRTSNLDLIQSIHQNVMNNQVNTNMKLMNALIAAYGKCGDLDSAKSLFNTAVNVYRDTDDYNGAVISMIGAFGANGEMNSAKELFESTTRDNDMICAALMSAYEANECFEAIIDLYNDMKHCELNDVCYLMVLKACAKSGRYEMGCTVQKHLETTANGRRMLRENVFLQTQMIDIYGKSGECDKALTYFMEQINDEMKRKDVVIWTAIIQCFGINGKADVSMQLFDEMVNKYGLKAEYVTYFVLINVLSHCQMTKDALLIFEQSKRNDKCNEKTYCAMIDGFARNNQLEDAYQLFVEYEGLYNSYSMKSYHQMLIALLNGCRKYNDLRIAKIVYRKIQKAQFNTKEDVRGNADTLMRDIYLQNRRQTATRTNIENDLQRVIHNM
eukprot:741239_1